MPIIIIHSAAIAYPSNAPPKRGDQRAWPIRDDAPEFGPGPLGPPGDDGLISCHGQCRCRATCQATAGLGRRTKRARCSSQYPKHSVLAELDGFETPPPLPSPSKPYMLSQSEKSMLLPCIPNSHPSVPALRGIPVASGALRLT